MRGFGYGTILVAGVVALGAGCSAGDTGSVAQRTCERLDTCNALDVGESVDDCTAAGEADLSHRSAAERADVEKLLADCLEFQTCSAYLHCLDPDGTSAPPPSARAQFALAWSISLDGAASTCAGVGADRVTLESTGPSGTHVDSFDCAALRGVTLPLPLGDYSLVFTVDAGAEELGRSEPFAARLDADGGLVDLGNFPIAFTSN